MTDSELDEFFSQPLSFLRDNSYGNKYSKQTGQDTNDLADDSTAEIAWMPYRGLDAKNKLVTNDKTGHAYWNSYRVISGSSENEAVNPEYGAALEGSKIFAKEFMTRHGVPTAPFIVVDSSNIAEAEEYLRGLSYPAVIKADGLCGGKGSVIVDSLADAQATLHDMLGGRFGDASRRVIIEDYLPGRECSVFVLTDGKDFAVLPVARDYKRAGDGDTGPNTGGMGAVSPVEYADSTFMERVAERVILPTVQGLQSDGIPYRGVLYLGLMEVGGEPYLLEYNVRMGDPETAVVLERTTGDVLRAFYSVARGAAREVCLGIAENAAVAVVVAAKGYPGAVKTGAPVTVETQPETGAAVLLGGAVKGADGVARVASGRVATVVGVDKDIFNARLIAYRTADTVKFLDASMRRDIAF